MRLPKRLRPSPGPSWPLALILLAYVALGVGYGIVNPALESPDEADHFRFVRYVAEERALPVASRTDPSEAHQPPLSYVLLAAATGWLPAPDLDALTRRNPWWGYDQGSVGSDNKNQYLHTPASSLGFSPAARALLAARLVDLLIGAIGVLARYHLALWAFSGSRGLAAAATGLGSLFPQFVFLQASVNNDVLLVSLSSLTLLLLAWIARSGARLSRAALVGAAIGLAVLTKPTALLLLPLVPIALVAAHGRLALRRLLGDLAVVGAIVLVLAGWWFLRNLNLYGEPTGLAIMQEAWKELRPAPLPVNEVFALLPNVERSFWGAFGWGNVPMPSWTYGSLRVLLILGAAGLVWGVARRLLGRLREPMFAGSARGAAPRAPFIAPAPDTAAVWGLLAVWCLFNGAALLQVMQTETLKDMGRHVFAAAGPAACLVVLGLSRLPIPRPRLVLGLVLPAAMAALSAWALLFVLAPAYAPPPAVADPSGVVAGRRLDYRFGEEIALIGADVAPTRVTSERTLTVTLYWQALRDLDRDYAVYVHVDPLAGGRRVGQRDSYPGAGNWPTSNWRQGEVVVDRYQLPLSSDRPVPSVWSVRAGLFDPQTQARPEVTAAGRPLAEEPPVGEATAPTHEATPPTASPVPVGEGDFAGMLRLQAFAVEPDRDRGRLEVTLYWQALRKIERAYTVYVHLVDAEGRLLAQHDGQPAGDAYPTTFWLPGEVVPDRHAISVGRPPGPGRSQLRVGLYDTATQAPLGREGAPGAIPPPYFTIELPAVP